MRIFPPLAWRTLVGNGTLLRYRTGDVLLEQGEPGSHVLALASGQVKVVRGEADGTSFLLAVRRAGDLLGELAVLDGGARSATVSALTPCLAHVVSAERFRAIVRRFDLYEDLLRHAIGRLREGEDIRVELAGLPAPTCLARTLLRLATGAEIPLTQLDLAAATGLSRSAVATELATLRRAGIIATARRRIVIRAPETLRRIAWDERPLLD
ncbi:Crp/Fnr family transcriptional regulator [Microtetraspora malaysiensis]|uniref:Crp/Fnr family transcriptional regulator n=1 Tax=Microtetraspora malaysiensis TaxID=161358 RepID=A0ABW6SI37_9ACTN